MKPSKCLAPVLVLILALAMAGCAHSDRAQIREAVEKDLDLLKNLDQETAQSYIPAEDLFSDAAISEAVAARVREIAPLFFQHFDYDVSDIQVDQKRGLASAKLRLRTIDAQALARDYSGACLKEEIRQKAALALEQKEEDEEEPATDGTEDAVSPENHLSVTRRFDLLAQVLAANEYDSKESSCPVTLTHTGEGWSIDRTRTLENNLVGGLISCLANPNLLSPDETLNLCLSALKEMSEEEMGAYLGIRGQYTDSEDSTGEIAAALLKQAKSCFAYEILDTQTRGYLADVTVRITSYDGSAIQSAYQSQMTEYLDTPEAVMDGEEARLTRSRELLLSCILENTAVADTEVVFHMTNDGAAWKLTDESDQLGDAIFSVI